MFPPKVKFRFVPALPVMALVFAMAIFPMRTWASTPQLTASPSNLAFSDVAIGQSKTMSTKLSNNGPSSVTITTATSSNGQFTTSGLKLPKILAVGASLELNVIFAPTKAGLASAQLSIVSNSKNPKLTITLSGTGTAAKGKLTITPSPLSFGSVAVGATATSAIGLSASGGSVDVSSITSNSTLFAVPGEHFPLTIAEGKEVLVNVTFTPKKDGSASADLIIASNASNSSASEGLSGTGTAPYVTVSWNASLSKDVSGYNVYRNTTKSGNGTKINSTLDPHTDYIDSTVISGKTYYYSTTAVASNGQESAHSEQVEIYVP